MCCSTYLALGNTASYLMACAVHGGALVTTLFGSNLVTGAECTYHAQIIFHHLVRADLFLAEHGQIHARSSRNHDRVGTCQKCHDRSVRSMTLVTPVIHRLVPVASLTRATSSCLNTSPLTMTGMLTLAASITCFNNSHEAGSAGLCARVLLPNLVIARSIATTYLACMASAWMPVLTTVFTKSTVSCTVSNSRILHVTGLSRLLTNLVKICRGC